MKMPILNIRVIGETQVTLFNSSISWELQDKIETLVQVISGAAPKVINFSNITNVRTMLFSGDGNYLVNITAGGQTISFESTDFFVFSPSAVFVATITNLSISSNSTSPVNVTVNIYGD